MSCVRASLSLSINFLILELNVLGGCGHNLLMCACVCMCVDLRVSVSTWSTDGRLSLTYPTLLPYPTLPYPIPHLTWSTDGRLS